MRPKIVFLYSEIAGYFLACVKALSKEADVMVVRRRVNKEAPFEFNFPDGVEILVKDDFSYISFIFYPSMFFNILPTGFY